MHVKKEPGNGAKTGADFMADAIMCLIATAIAVLLHRIWIDVACCIGYSALTNPIGLNASCTAMIPIVIT